MDSRFVNHRISNSYRSDRFANYSKPCYESKRKKKDKKFSDDNRKLKPGLARLHVDAERKLWKVTEVVHPSIQNFRN